MKPRATLELIAVLACLTIIPASVATSLAEQTAFTMRPAKLYADDTAEPKIIGGTKAVPADWPATFVFLDPEGRGCTSTAVGERVILTAAHCIADKGVGVVDWKNKTIRTSCYRHPGYRDGVATNDPDWAAKVSPDFALCVTDQPLQEIVAENVDKVGTALVKGRDLHLLGFGCNAKGGSDAGFGVLYEGDAPITEIPAAGSYYTRAEGGAAVCYGDSGAGAFLFLNQAKTRRVLMGVNSRGDIARVSFVSTTSVEGFWKWADQFARDHGVSICGLESTAKGCRPL